MLCFCKFYPVLTPDKQSNAKKRKLPPSGPKPDKVIPAVPASVRAEHGVVPGPAPVDQAVGGRLQLSVGGIDGLGLHGSVPTGGQYVHNRILQRG